MSQAKEGATVTTSGPEPAVSQFTTAELAMVFTPQAPDPRYK